MDSQNFEIFLNYDQKWSTREKTRLKSRRFNRSQIINRKHGTASG